jgi:hypothetical protein
MCTAQWSLYVPQSGHYMYRTAVTICTAQWSLYVPPGITFNNPTFCPHSVFMCFVWIWEQTAIIFLYSINWLVCITVTECVYCAVGIEYLYVIHVKIPLETVKLKCLQLIRMLSSEQAIRYYARTNQLIATVSSIIWRFSDRASWYKLV